tara:strand:- start:1109 stop:1525 length:417 start_codon:yes stop_codon:yes gene_type:complete
MFKKKELEAVYNLLIKKELAQANNLLINLRKFGVLHPEYLFLMSLFLMETGRTYLAIDSLLLSLKVDNTAEVMKKNDFEGTSEELVKKRYETLISVLEKIKLMDLKNRAIEAMDNNDASEFLKHLSEVMPGIRLKNKL